MAVKIAKSKKISIGGQRLPRPSATTKSAGKLSKSHKAAALRSSITPGTVLILLAGRFRGKRVVFLNQLPSGLLLVTGPYKVNGVPLRRVSQAYVIATSTKIDISSVTLSDKLNDELFKRVNKESRVKKHTLKHAGETESEKKENSLSQERKALQSQIDGQLVPIIKAVPLLTSYMGSFFSLNKGQTPHAMKF